MTNDVYTLFVRNFEDLPNRTSPLSRERTQRALLLRFASVLSDSDLVSHLEIKSATSYDVIRG